MAHAEAGGSVRAARVLRLHLVQGPQSGTQLEQKTGDWLQVGRTAKSQVQIKDPSISVAHAELVLARGYWLLRDKGSTNGTTHNGTRLVGKPSDLVRLRDGDLLGFGDTVARVELVKPHKELTVEEHVLEECGRLEQLIR